ncbi:MAG: UvrD-helicase domain-containing protein [Dehalococcoidia bacterium]|nr:UvrD-helicase domain-containing protein [Dehalococcoidia bacterium]
MTAPLADQAARERIATALDATLFVEAGAGTGKTSELVNRIVALVRGGLELQQIAAITFTEAAAAELRDRIRARLEGEVRESGDDAGRFQQALGQIDAASISTLHGFAQRIIALYPLEAGMPPKLEILDDVRGRIAFDERWRELIETLLSDDSHGLPIVAALRLGLTVGYLHELARELHARWDRLAAFRFPEAEPKLDLAELFAALDGVRGQLECCRDETDRLFALVQTAVARYDDLLAATSEDERLAVLKAKFQTGGNLGRADLWGGRDVRDEVRAGLKCAEEARARVLKAYHAAHVLPLLERVRQFVLEYAAERRARGMLEFHDLLVLARDLLRENADVRHAVAARYRAILIDEFQDTDPIQLEIAALLATDEPDVAGKPWHALPIAPGRLFFVGDPKQAIYRFRGADIGLYRQARQAFGAEEVLLKQNFRTVRRSVRWVNEVFERLMREGDGDAQPRYVALDARRPDVSAALPVVLLGRPNEAATNVDDVRRLEAAELVTALREVKARGWTIVDRDTKEQRAAEYGDIAVLLPTRTTLPWLERELEAQGVPYRIVSRSLLYNTQEVRDLTNILAAIDDPTDQVALVAALRSPAFACRDDELVAWVQARGKWDYTATYRWSSAPGERHGRPEPVPADHPVAEAMEMLRALHDERWWLGLNELIERVIRERKLFELAFAFNRPRERWQRLRFVLDQARAFAEAGGTTLREFVAWLRQQADDDVMVTDTVVAQEDDDAVRIMTIHAAKGLEFPVVALAGLNVKELGTRDKLLWREDGPPEFRTGNETSRFETAGYAALAGDENQQNRHEKLRLLYVGATRARDHLIVSVHHIPNRDPAATHAGLLWAACQEIRDHWRPFEETPGTLDAMTPAAVTMADDGLDEGEWRRQRENLIASAVAPRARAATEIAGTGEAEDDASHTWRRGRAGTNIGRAVHTTLQAIDLATGEGLDAAAEAQAAAEGIPWAAREVAELARAALRAPSVRRAVQGRYWREVYVGAPAAGTVLEGFIDLLYDTPEGLVIVDYKTDRVDKDEEIDAAMERYRLQGAVYALALGELAGRLGRPVAGCTFVFLRGAEPRERHITDLPGVIAEVEARLAAPARRERLA